MTQCVSSQHPNWLSLCASRDSSIPVPLSGAFPAPAAAEQTQFHICSHRGCVAPCEWGSQRLCLMQEAAPAHLKVKWSLVLAPWGSTSRVQPCGKPGQRTDLAENYPCLLAQLSAAPGAWPGSPVSCINTGQKNEVYGNEWPEKYTWRVH